MNGEGKVGKRVILVKVTRHIATLLGEQKKKHVCRVIKVNRSCIISGKIRGLANKYRKLCDWSKGDDVMCVGKESRSMSLNN